MSSKEETSWQTTIYHAISVAGIIGAFVAHCYYEETIRKLDIEILLRGENDVQQLRGTDGPI